MATSGSFDTTHRIAGSYNTYAHFDWWQTGQSTANNTTSIDWTFSGRTASSRQYIYVYGASVTVDGSTKSGWSGNMYNGTQMLSGSKTIWHNSDGTKSFGASGYITQYSSSANYSGSGSWTLNTIPRKATLKTYPDFNDEDNPTITYENKAGTSVSTLQACISLTGSADDIAYRDISKTGTSYTFNLTQAERNVLLNATTTSNTRKVIFYIKTVIGSNTFYDTKEVTFSVVNANPTFSNFTYSDTNSTTTAITGNNQYIIQGKSTLRATIASANKATANKNATMVQYDFAIAGYAGTEAYTTSDINKDIGVINASVDQALQVVARDSRDNTTTVQKNVYMVPYASPSIIATATRQANFESNTTIHISGAMSLLSVAGVTKNAVNASNGIKWRYKESTSSTWGSWTNVASTTSADGTVSVADFVRTFDNKKAWDLQFSITDKLETKTINVSLGQGQPQFFIGSDGRSSVGGLPSIALPSSNTGQLEVYGDVYAKNLRSTGNAYANGNRLAEIPINDADVNWTGVEHTFVKTYDTTIPANTSMDYDIPIDLETYRHQVIEMSYEPNSGGSEWHIATALNNNKTAVSTTQYGTEIENGSGRFVYRTGTQVIAWGFYVYGSIAVKIDLFRANEGNWLVYHAKGFGGQSSSANGARVQDFQGRIEGSSEIVKYIRLPVRNSQAGGHIVVYGMK